MDKACMRVIVKHLCSPLQKRWPEHVISVKKNYILARSQIETAIPVGCLADELFKSHVTNSLIVVTATNIRSLIRRSVVADHQFVIGELLGEHTLDGLGQIPSGVVSGNANAYFRIHSDQRSAI
jgi:hypothetical protein